MQAFLDAILAGATGADLAAIPLPESYRAAFVRKEDVAMFEGLDSPDKDPRKSLYVDEVPTPEIAPDEVVLDRASARAAGVKVGDVMRSVTVTPVDRV